MPRGGFLTIGEPGGPTWQRFAIVAGGSLVTDVNGRSVRFDLEPVLFTNPPAEFDVRSMSTVDLARYLVERLDEEREREWTE